MQLNREQVNQILNAAPKGTDKKKILDGLVIRGYKIEGVDTDAVKKSLTSTETQNSFGSETTGDIKQTGKEILSSVKDRSKNIQQITSDVNSGKINPIRGGFQTAGQVAGGVADVIGSTLKGAVKTVMPDKVEQDISQVVQKFGAKVVAIPEVQNIINKYNALPPEKQRDIDAVGGIINLVSTFIGGKGATVAGEAIGTGAKTVSKGVKSSITSGVETATSKIASMAENASPQIMNKVARLTPTQANKFKQIAGMTHGEYLAKTGNFANPEKIITNEATKFAQSVKAVDETLASLPGKYKNGAINDALDSLVKKAQSVSTDSVKSPYLKEATSLLKKANKDGLTMKEMNQAKRLFEKNVKLGYNKMLNPKEVELATNIDNAVREFQFKTAKKLGFKNLDEMNKQTQISRELVNSLGKQLTGKTGLNDVSLTDWIMLSGGDPTAVGGLLTKKLFGNKTVQARIAKMLNKNKPAGQIKPVVKSSKLK